MHSSQTFHLIVRRTAVALAACLMTNAAFAAGIYKPVGANIATYDLLGVKLGMSEADATAAIRKRFPPGSKDAEGRAVNLRQTDYVLTSPATHAKVKAGVRFDLYPETKSNLNFIKIFIHEGRVWGIWRDDASGKYDYERMTSELKAKYSGAAEIPSSFMVVNGGSISSRPGAPAIDGVHSFEGQCIDFPFIRRSDNDSIKLDPSCKKAFGVLYSPQDKNGAKIMASGFGQLVDLDAGREFMRFMASGAGNINGEKPRVSDAKL